MSDESARLEALLQAVPIFASDYCRVTRDATGEDLFGQRQALLAGIVITVLTVIGLSVSIPYWHMLGILAR